MLAFIYLPTILVVLIVFAHGVVAVRLYVENRRHAKQAAATKLPRGSFHPRVIPGGRTMNDAHHPARSSLPQLRLVGADD
jgi:hypothetical protein